MLLLGMRRRMVLRGLRRRRLRSGCAKKSLSELHNLPSEARPTVRGATRVAKLLQARVGDRVVIRGADETLDEPVEGFFSMAGWPSSGTDTPVKLRVRNFELGRRRAVLLAIPLDGNERPIREDLELPHDVVGHVRIAVDAKRISFALSSLTLKAALCRAQHVCTTVDGSPAGDVQLRGRQNAA